MAVEEKELWELVEKWRNESEYMSNNVEEYARPAQTKGAADCMEDMADELEDLLNE